jgi:hypothetical protein
MPIFTWSHRPAAVPGSALEATLYIARAQFAVERFIAGDPHFTWIADYATRICDDCSEIQTAADGNHVVYRDLLIVGCEGYRHLPPQFLGLDGSNWEDWTKS